MSDSCPPHWWIIGEKRTYFTRADHQGDLVEEAQMMCKHCGEERLNVCVIPPEVIPLYDGVNR